MAERARPEPLVLVLVLVTPSAAERLAAGRLARPPDGPRP